MRWWDESMFAVNTYEMMHNGHYFSPHFNGAPDICNTKPPLTSWFQIISVKIFGYNEMALRLPSALAAAFSILILFLFIARRYDKMLAWISALVLLTSQGFITFHTARTADADSLLTFFLLIANLYFLKFLLDEKRTDVLLFFIFITLAFATKMYAALLFCPAYPVILLMQKKLKLFTLNIAFFSGILIFIFISAGMAYAREMAAPGYLNEVFFKDAGRVLHVVENHREATLFYLDNLFAYRFAAWFILLIAGVVLSFFTSSKTEKKLLISLSILSIVYLIIISASVTKLEWYDMPLFPLLSVMAAYPLFLLLKNFSFAGKPLSQKFCILFIVAIFAFPYYTIFNRSQGNTLPNGQKKLEANEAYLLKRGNEKMNLDGVKVYHKDYNGSLLFYKYKLAEKGQKIEICNTDNFSTNDKVLVCDDSLKALLNKTFECIIIDSYNNAQLMQLKAKREITPSN